MPCESFPLGSLTECADLHSDLRRRVSNEVCRLASVCAVMLTLGVSHDDVHPFGSPFHKQHSSTFTQSTISSPPYKSTLRGPNSIGPQLSRDAPRLPL